MNSYEDAGPDVTDVRKTAHQRGWKLGSAGTDRTRWAA